MFCKNCGAEIREGASFCGKCGTPTGGAANAGGQSQEPVINFTEVGQKAKAVAGKGVEGAKRAANALDEKITKMSQDHQEKKRAQQEEMARMQAMAPNQAQMGQGNPQQGAAYGGQAGQAQGGYNQNVPPQQNASGYGFAPIWNYKPNYNYKPIGMWGYFGWDLLFFVLSIIPIIGWLVELVVLLVFSFRGHGNINLRNYARSKFCFLIIVIIIFIVIGIVSRAGIFWLFKI